MGVRTIYLTDDDERRMSNAAADLQAKGVDVTTSSRATDDWYSRVLVIRALLDHYLERGDRTCQSETDPKT